MHLIDLWSEVDTEVLDGIDPKRFDPKYFWCTPKFKAFQKQQKPFVYLDLDLIAWEKIEPNGHDLCALHYEHSSYEMRNSHKALQVKQDFHMRPEWNLDRDLAYNVACLYFGDNDFKDEYCQTALDFMDGNKIRPVYPDKLWTLSGFTPEILFVEQTLLRVLAEHRKMDVGIFIDAVYDTTRWDFVKDDPGLGRWKYYYPDHQCRFTHLWMYKHAVKSIPVVRVEYVRTLLQAVIHYFPEQINRLQRISAFDTYWEDPLFKQLVS